MCIYGIYTKITSYMINYKQLSAFKIPTIIAIIRRKGNIYENVFVERHRQRI